VLLVSCNPEEKTAALSPDPAVAAQQRIKEQCLALVKLRQQARPLTGKHAPDIGNLADVASEAGTTEAGEAEVPSTGKQSASAQLAALVVTLSDMRPK